MASDLKGLIQESLGPLPRVCQEQVMLDLERARMTAEDARADAARMRERIIEAQAIAMSTTMIVDVTRRDLRDALIETSDALGEAIGARNRETDEEMSDEDDTVMAAEEESESDDDDALHCVLCRTSGGHRMYFNMEPQGRWAGLAPGARIVCAMCYRDEMGVVESASSRQRRPSP